MSVPAASNDGITSPRALAIVRRPQHFLVTAGLLVVALLAMSLFYWECQVWVGRGIFGWDLRAFYDAALQLARHGSPYLTYQLQGPYSAQALNAYLYPPSFAAVIWPVTRLGFGTLRLFWAILQTLFAGLAMIIAWRSSGRVLHLNGVLVIITVLGFSLPVIYSVQLGNLGGLIALALALALWFGRRDGWSKVATVLTIAGWIKLAPFLILPAVWRLGRWRALAVTILVSTLCVLPFLLLAPRAWLEFPMALLNLLHGSGVYTANYAPAALLVLVWPSLASIGLLLSALVLLAAAGLFILSLRWAATPRGWPGALTAAVLAGLFFPATLWLHYFVVLLPLLVVAWAGSPWRGRLILLGGWLLLDLSWILLFGPSQFIPLGASLGLSGMTLLAVGLIWGLRPSRSVEYELRTAS